MSDSPKSSTSTSIIIKLMSLIFYALTLKVLYDLKKTNCKCSDDSRHTYVMVYMYYGLAILILGLFGIQVYKYIHPIFVFVALVYVITMCFVTAIYLRNLSQPDCGCETTDLQKYIRYIWYFNCAMIVIMLIGFVLMMLGGGPSKSKSVKA